VTVLDYPELIQVLYKNGVNMNLKARNSNLTPLIIAAARGFDRCVTRLMSCGAKILPTTAKSRSTVRDRDSINFSVKLDENEFYNDVEDFGDIGSCSSSVVDFAL